MLLLIDTYQQQQQQQKNSLVDMEMIDSPLNASPKAAPIQISQPQFQAVDPLLQGVKKSMERTASPSSLRSLSSSSTLSATLNNLVQQQQPQPIGKIVPSIKDFEIIKPISKELLDLFIWQRREQQAIITR